MQMKSRISHRRICRTWMTKGIKSSQKKTTLRPLKLPTLPCSRRTILLSPTRWRIQWYSWRTPQRRRGLRRTKTIHSKATARTPLQTLRRNGNKTQCKRLKAMHHHQKQRTQSKRWCPLKTSQRSPLTWSSNRNRSLITLELAGNHFYITILK